MLTLYSMPSSGNSHKVRLLFKKLGIEYRHVAAEYGSGVTRSPEFLEKNPHGRVPLVEWDDGRVLSESNAILCHFGEGTRFIPGDPFKRAKMFEWMFWEQNSHEATVAVRAAILNYRHREAERRSDVLDPLFDAGQRNLYRMEIQLQKTPYLIGDEISLADLSLYPYSATAESRGGFDLSDMPALEEWLRRVEQDPDHIPLDWLPEEKG
ncbi:glutathione S-transferase family protein [Notoacmeibacter ruber]|uniref:Glutathione S-transferase family protein n=1 Tax=Notoacmeibacter ruber TaxID=2670375 RepID=A0A3L7JC18_9HYPH|nr:glutathione S-transferase family protein [Notoacmeibacter ruber]RLQ88298.1 glutathione S-transferase family protein [Notoacmeibacter ruber]